MPNKVSQLITKAHGAAQNHLWPRTNSDRRYQIEEWRKWKQWEEGDKKMPGQMTLGEFKTDVLGTPYSREAEGEGRIQLGVGEVSDLAESGKVLSDKDRAVVGKAMKIFTDDPRNVPVQSTKWLRKTLRAMGIHPTTDDKKQLAFQVCRALASGKYGGGAVILSETRPVPHPVHLIEQEVRPMDLVLSQTDLAFPRNTHPKTIRLSMSSDTVFIQNLSKARTLDIGGCNVVAIFKRRRATVVQPEDDGYTGGKWTEAMPNPSFEFPANLHIPPGGVLHVVCGKGKDHVGECADVPIAIQKICWTPYENPVKECWGVALLDSTGRRNQLVTKTVLKGRRKADVRAEMLRQGEVASKASPTPAALFAEFTDEINAVYEKGVGGGGDEYAEDAEHLPSPTYHHQVTALHNLVKADQHLRESRPLTHPDHQGIIPPYTETTAQSRKRHAVGSFRSVFGGV